MRKAKFSKSLRFSLILIMPLLVLLLVTIIFILSLLIIIKVPEKETLKNYLPTNTLYRQQPRMDSATATNSAAPRDTRIAKIESYLKSNNRQILVPFSALMVETADKYQIHWALIPAIAGQESSFCQNIPANSFNCWGNLENLKSSQKFGSYPESINQVGQGIKAEIVDKGGFSKSCETLKNPPPTIQNWKSWCMSVNQYVNEIETFSK